MFLRIASIGSKFIGDSILTFDGSVTPQDIRNNFATQGLVPQVFNTFDLNHDGVVTFSELQASSHPGGVNLPAVQNLLPAVQDTLRLILAEMALGAGGEQVANLPGVKLSDLPRRLCTNDRGDDDDHGNDSPKVCPIFPEPPDSRQTRSDN